MTKNELQNVDLNQIQQIGDFGVPELMAMKESVAKKLTIPQFNLFMYQMNRMGLDPNLGHAVPIMYGQDLNIRVEYEGYKSLAQDSDGYQGVHTQVICENEAETFEAVTDDEGIITNVHHKIKMPRGKVIGAYAIAKREGKKNIVIICEAPEFDKYAKKNPTFWLLSDKSLDPDMCKKFVATRAVKAQYDIAAAVEVNSGLLTSGADGLEPYERKEINPNATDQEQKQEEPKKEDEKKKADPEEPKKEAITYEQAISEMNVKFAALGIESKEEKVEYTNKNANIKGERPTVSELLGLLKIMEMDIENRAAQDDDLLV